MTSSKLSTAAQIVWDAAWQLSPVNCESHEDRRRQQIAAALRAAADQAQASLYYTAPTTDWSKGWKQGVSDAAQGFLAIADELEGVRYVYNPVQIAECGGPCSQGPQHCDCGALRVDDQTPTPPVAQARQLTDQQLIDAAIEAGLCFPKCWSLDTTPEDIADDDAWVQDGFNQDEATGQHRQQLLNDARQLRANNLQRLRAFAALIQAAGNS